MRLTDMAMGRQEQRATRKSSWIAHAGPAVAPGPPFYLGCASYSMRRSPAHACKHNVRSSTRQIMDVRCWRMTPIAGVFRSNLLKASRPSAGSPVRVAEFAARAAELLPGDTVKGKYPWSLCEVGTHL